MVHAFWLLLFSLSSFSQESLQEIDVSISKEASDFFAGSVEVIGKDKIKETGYGELSQTLSSVPGVIAHADGGFGSRTSVFIRGAESRHTAFSIDGLRINDPSNTDRQFDGAYINPLILSEIKVYKGPQSIFYGPDAMAGLVEMTTSKGNGRNETEFILGGGSFDSYRSMLTQDWGRGDHKGRLSASAFKTHGISRLNKKRFNATEDDASLTYQLVSSSSHKFAKVNTDLLVGYNYGESELDSFASDSVNDHSRSHQFFFQQKSSYRLSSRDSITLRTGQNRYNREIFSVSPSNHYLGSTTQVDLFWDQRTRNWHTLLGSSVDLENFEIDRQQNKDNTLFSSYLTQKWMSDIFEFSYGLRHDHHQRFGNLYTYSASPALNLGELRFDYVYATGFKAPSLYQLYAPPMFGAPLGNKELEPERSYTHTVNLSFPLMNGEFALSIFENSYQDLISWSGVSGYFNQQSFKALGIESSWKFSFRNAAIRPYFLIQDFRDEESTILRRPRNHWGLDLNWSINSLISAWSKLEHRSASKDFDENGGIVKLNSYEKIDLGITYTQTVNAFTLKVMNILDRDYEQLYGYSVQPRSFMIEWAGKI